VDDHRNTVAVAGPSRRPDESPPGTGTGSVGLIWTSSLRLITLCQNGASSGRLVVVTDEEMARPTAETSDDRVPYAIVEVDGHRVVTHTFTGEDGSPVSIESTHRIGVEHWYAPGDRNDPIPLYRGVFRLSVEGNEREYDGTATFVWTPRSAIKISGSRSDPPFVGDVERMLSAETSMWVPRPAFSLLNADVPVQAATLSEPDATSISAGTFIDETTNLVKVGVAARYDRLTFLVPNGWRAHDGFPVGDPSDPNNVVRGGILASSGGWEVYLHPRVDRPGRDPIEGLRRSGGFDVTHVGLARKIDRSRFSDDEAWHLRTTLRLCMSLACGRTTGPILPVAWQGDLPVAAEWNGPPIDAWRNVQTWLDPNYASQQMRDLLTVALNYCDDGKHQALLRHAVSFLVTANYDADVELAVAVPVSGLQMLAYARLVDQQGRFTPKEFQKDLDTEEQIRLLLSDCMIDVGMPIQFQHLRDAAGKIRQITGEKTDRDALSTVVFLRNKIIHPTKVHPDHWSIYEWAEASFVSKHLLTLAILNTVGYEGVEHSPLSEDRWQGSVSPVPWGVTTH